MNAKLSIFVFIYLIERVYTDLAAIENMRFCEKNHLHIIVIMLKLSIHSIQ